MLGWIICRKPKVPKFQPHEGENLWIAIHKQETRSNQYDNRIIVYQSTKLCGGYNTYIGNKNLIIGLL